MPATQTLHHMYNLVQDVGKLCVEGSVEGSTTCRDGYQQPRPIKPAVVVMSNRWDAMQSECNTVLACLTLDATANCTNPLIQLMQIVHAVAYETGSLCMISCVGSSHLTDYALPAFSRRCCGLHFALFVSMGMAFMTEDVVIVCQLDFCNR